MIEKSEQSPGFLCRQCGNCCCQPGLVRLLNGEPESISGFLHLPVEEFVNRYTRLTPDRGGLSLQEAHGGACVFLKPDRTCHIQDVKPRQCREFPITWRFEGFETICLAERERRKRESK